MHSSEYTNPAIWCKDKNVVVLGFSKSATDIAVNAVHSGAKSVTIVYRESVWRIPYFHRRSDQLQAHPLHPQAGEHVSGLGP